MNALTQSSLSLIHSLTHSHTQWANVPFSFLVQVSVGSVYAWSLFNGPLTLQNGVVAAASTDWALESVVPIFSMAGGCSVVQLV
jgi:hypothetical protein